MSHEKIKFTNQLQDVPYGYLLMNLDDGLFWVHQSEVSMKDFTIDCQKLSYKGGPFHRVARDGFEILDVVSTGQGYFDVITANGGIQDIISILVMGPTITVIEPSLL